MFRTKCDMGSNPSDNEQAYALNNLLTSVSECKVPLSFQLQDLYDHFEVKLNDFEVSF